MKKMILLGILLSIFACSKTVEVAKNQGQTPTPTPNPNTSTQTTFDDVTIPTGLIYYYQGVDFNKNGNDLYQSLAILTIGKHSNILEYAQRHPYLAKADASLTDKTKVVLIYSGKEEAISNRNTTFNTEHVYPQSLLNGGKNSKGYGDLHHLRYCYEGDNTERGNRAFTDGSGSSGPVGVHWYPGDDWRGDVARMLLYMNLRYNEAFDKVSTNGVNLFLKWNAEDPVSDFEKQRNNEIEAVQKNRNPFIDNPYLATKIWGGAAATNTWK